MATALGWPAKYESGGFEGALTQTDMVMRMVAGGRRVIGCLAIKGPWQFELPIGSTMMTADPECFEPCLQQVCGDSCDIQIGGSTLRNAMSSHVLQVYGDAVLEEAHVAVLTNFNQTVIITRSPDAMCTDILVRLSSFHCATPYLKLSSFAHPSTGI